jgi:hypothetical protein
MSSEARLATTPLQLTNSRKVGAGRAQRARGGFVVDKLERREFPTGILESKPDGKVTAIESGQ